MDVISFNACKYVYLVTAFRSVELQLDFLDMLAIFAQVQLH